MLHQIAGGAGPFGKVELEARFKESLRDNATTLENQLSFCPQKDRSQFQHPVGRRQPYAGPPGIAQNAHEFLIRQRARRADVDAAIQRWMIDQEINRPYKVSFVNPGNKLFSRCCFSAQPHSNKLQKSIKNPAPIRTHGHCAAESDLPRAGRCSGKKFPLPACRHVNAEAPCRRCIGFVASQFTSRFIHGAVQRVPIDCGSTGVHPEGRRLSCLSNGLSHQAGRKDSGLHDLAAVSRRVTAIHVAAGQVDNDVGAVDSICPDSQVTSAPRQGLPRRALWVAGKHGDRMPLTMEMPCQHIADLTTASRNDDAQFLIAG